METYVVDRLNFHFYIEGAMGFIMVLCLILLFQNLRKRNQGIGENVLQYICISFIIPAIVILGLEDILKGETVATLLSGIGGYGLSQANGRNRQQGKPVLPSEPPQTNSINL